MSDMTGDPTWDGGWEDAEETGDRKEVWMLRQETESRDELGREPKPGSKSHQIRDLELPDI